VPDGGYRWWYLDALSDDGSQALTIIAFIGSVFSPWYASARRRGTAPAEDFCSVNAAFYTPRGKRWAMTERGASALSRSVDHLQIGPSALHWQNGCLTIDLDELTVPLPGRLRGKVTLQAETGVGSARALHPNGRHFWQPLAPLARIDVHMTQPNLRWQGEAYMDSNWGSEPLEAAFSRWHWSRAKMADGSCAVLYNTMNLDGSNTALALCCSAGGEITEIPSPPAAELPTAAIWRMGRSTLADQGHEATVLRTLEDTPFYARSLLRTTLAGETVNAVHESLSLERFQRRWVQTLLPFRMPRRRHWKM
jgi:carotenoid 1,2-hydratase